MTWFKNLRTLTKLMLSFGLIALLLLVVGYQGRRGMRALEDKVEAMYTRDVAGVSAAKDINITIGLIARDVRQFMLESDPAAVAAVIRKVEGHFVTLEEVLARADKTFTNDEGKAVLAKFRTVLPEYHAQVQEIERMTVAHEDKAALALLVRARATGQRQQDAATAAIEMKDRLLKESYEESKQFYASTQNMIAGVVVGAVLLALIMGYFLARLVSKPLVQTVDVLQALADGDLTRSLTLETKDEVGAMATALNRAVTGMRQALLEVRASADEVSEASAQLAAGSEELSSGAQEQASSLEETSASLEQITSSVRHNADNATQASELASSARSAADNGRQVVSSAVNAMGEINASSKRIAEIITAVDEIAFQTNLLALNAAVEAARAGEQGRGFAVVASEVRNLAQRSATAAKEIKALITDSVRKVETGAQMVNQSDAVLVEIVASVQRVTGIVAEIAAASREQSVGIDQVAKAMSQVDIVTQQNAAQTEELSSAAQTLSGSAEQLQGLVTRFKLNAA